MLKFLSLLSFTLFYLSASAQKVSYYIDKTVNLNKYNYFYLNNSTIDAHDLTNPYLNKNSLSVNEISYFIAYNELSLKNLTIIDDHADNGTFFVNLYEAALFDATITTPPTFKSKKLKKNSLIIDMVDGGSKMLIWRGWVDISKIKANSQYERYQKAISSVLSKFKIEPVIAE